LTPCMCGSRCSCTIGVSPVASVTDANTRPRPGRWVDFARDDARGVVAEGIRIFSDRATPSGRREPGTRRYNRESMNTAAREKLPAPSRRTRRSRCVRPVRFRQLQMPGPVLCESGYSERAHASHWRSGQVPAAYADAFSPRRRNKTARSRLRVASRVSWRPRARSHRNV
jgi:hypothetical protein